VSRSTLQLLIAIPVAAIAVSVGGCGSLLPGHLGGIATEVSDEDYAERLCGYLDLEQYPACVSELMDRYEQKSADDDPGHGRTGPFAVIMEGGVYMGTYETYPFSGSFSVSNGENRCRGSFAAATETRDALFDVYCDDGRSGWADIIRATDGRNGIGQITLDDGTKGDIVFGYHATGQAKPYPWGDVWLPKVSSTKP
jgi:hypothetical protein